MTDQPLNKRVILLDGPENSGRRTAATRMVNYLNLKITKSIVCTPQHYRLEDHAIAAAHVLYGVPNSYSYYEKEYGKDWRMEPQKEFFGDSPNFVYATVASCADTEHGRILARRIAINKQASVGVISDVYNINDIIPVVLKFGARNVLHVRVTRPGTSFMGDSRTYIDVGSHPVTKEVKSVELPNPADLDLFRILTQGVVKGWLGIEDE